MRLAAAPFAVSALLAAAGCGGGGKASAPPPASTTVATSAPTTTGASKTVPQSDYVKTMQALGQRIGTVVSTVYPIDTGTRGSKLQAQTLKRLRHAHAVFASVLAQVRTLKAPAKIASEQRTLVRGLTGVTDDLAELVHAIERGDLRATMTPSRLTALTLITSATTKMESKGFDVLGKHA